MQRHLRPSSHRSLQLTQGHGMLGLARERVATDTQQLNLDIPLEQAPQARRTRAADEIVGEIDAC